MSLAPPGGHDHGAHRRRPASDPGAGSLHAGGRARPRRRGRRRDSRSRGGPSGVSGPRPARRAHARARRARGVPPFAPGPAPAPDAHRHAHRRRPASRSSAGVRGRSRRVPGQALFSAGAARARADVAAGATFMAGEVALSQALSFARDLKSLYETSRARERDLSEANMRLRAAHRQTLHYASDLKKMHRRAEQGALHSLVALADALEGRHAFTLGHSARVSAWSRRLALASGLPEAAAEVIAQAGRLHDLGKIGVAPSILSQAGPLTAEEQALLRDHPLTGARILAPLEF